MRMYRFFLGAMTASFRYPRMMIGTHPTFKVPPVSTIYGLLSAAKGSLVTPQNSQIGYIFESEAVFNDLESIYQIESGSLIVKPNIMIRQQLFNVKLWLYVDPETAKTLENPCYPLFLGRSTDLLYLYESTLLNLTKKELAKVGKSCFPYFPKGTSSAEVHSLPIYLTDSIPRQPVGSRMFFLIPTMVETSDLHPQIYVDEEMNWGVYIYDQTIFDDSNIA